MGPALRQCEGGRTWSLLRAPFMVQMRPAGSSGPVPRWAARPGTLVRALRCSLLFAAVSWSAGGGPPAGARHRWRHCGPDAGRPASGRSSPGRVHWPAPCSSVPSRQLVSSRLAQARQSCPQPALLLAAARAALALAVHWARGVLVAWLPAGDWLRLTGLLHSCGRSAVLPRVSAFLPRPAPGSLQGGS